MITLLWCEGAVCSWWLWQWWCWWWHCSAAKVAAQNATIMFSLLSLPLFRLHPTLHPVLVPKLTYSHLSLSHSAAYSLYLHIFVRLSGCVYQSLFKWTLLDETLLVCPPPPPRSPIWTTDYVIFNLHFMQDRTGVHAICTVVTTSFCGTHRPGEWVREGRGRTCWIISWMKKRYSEPILWPVTRLVLLLCWGPLEYRLRMQRATSSSSSVSSWLRAIVVDRIIDYGAREERAHGSCPQQI